MGTAPAEADGEAAALADSLTAVGPCRTDDSPPSGLAEHAASVTTAMDNPTNRLTRDLLDRATCVQAAAATLAHHRVTAGRSGSGSPELRLAIQALTPPAPQSA